MRANSVVRLCGITTIDLKKFIVTKLTSFYVFRTLVLFLHKYHHVSQLITFNYNWIHFATVWECNCLNLYQEYLTCTWCKTNNKKPLHKSTPRKN